jgi:hypothetical protein
MPCPLKHDARSAHSRVRLFCVEFCGQPMLRSSKRGDFDFDLITQRPSSKYSPGTGCPFPVQRPVEFFFLIVLPWYVAHDNKFKLAPPSRVANPLRSRPVLPIRVLAADRFPWPLWRLIANARLETPATSTKQKMGRTSNRKWIAISNLRRRPAEPRRSHEGAPLDADHPPRMTAFLIYGSAIRNPRKRLKT